MKAMGWFRIENPERSFIWLYKPMAGFFGCHNEWAVDWNHSMLMNWGDGCGWERNSSIIVAQIPAANHDSKVAVNHSK